MIDCSPQTINQRKQLVGNGFIRSVIPHKHPRSAMNKTAPHTGKVWQSSFYDHIVRNDADHRNIWQYISGNPSRWADDCFYIK